MSKQKSKNRRQEKEHEAKRHPTNTHESALLKPQPKNVLLLVTSGGLLLLWLIYLFVVAMWGL